MYSKEIHVGILISGILLLLLFYLVPSHFKTKILTSKNTTAVSKVQPHRVVLLVYVFAWSNEYAIPNMNYFITHAVREDDPVDYYFILQQINKTNIDERMLPNLPKNAHYIHHENKCFDYGTIGWFLSQYTVGNPHRNYTSSYQTKKIDLRSYKYFIFMNSSTRGPYFPPYYNTMMSVYEAASGKKLYWYSVFTDRITDKVKFVGPTIGCSYSPHIQNYVAATDFIGLSVALKSDGSSGPFDCHPTFEAAVLYGEIGFSTKILSEGYMIDCLMRKYQRLNFSAPENRDCNGKGNPHQIKGVDNISLDPYEIVFVKFNYKRYDWDAADRSKVYDQWTEEVKNNTAKY